MSDPTDRLSAALEDRYRIDRQLGEGGMATVYLAEDLRHHRQVAIKVLRPELAAVIGAERFLREIETTANLQHPHILPLFDSGEADSFLFYVMPYVEGESLRDRLDRERQLPVDEAVRIATNVAEALDYAHAQGVIHRDIKPENILLQAGKPVVSDFGIALALGAAGGGRLTETGLSLGTPHYMSPEQATGDQHVGLATDLWALGCVLYEMSVGEPPYTGSTPQAVLGKIVTEDAPSVSAERKAVPPNVDAAILRALEKLPADRFGSADEFVRALGDPSFRWGSGPATTGAEAGVHRAWRPAALALGVVAIVLLGLLTRPPASSRANGAAAVRHTSILFPEEPATGELLRPVAANPERALAISADGNRIIYAARGTQGAILRTRLLSERGSDVPIEGTQGATAFFLSPDGNSVAFNHDRENALKRVPITGGQGVTVVEFGSGADRTWFGGAWGQDGTIVYGTMAAGLRRISLGGGPVVELTTAGQELDVWHRQPNFLPDGSGVVFTVTDTEAAVERQDEIAVLPFGGDPVTLTEGHSPIVTSNGLLIFSRGSAGDLWAARIAEGFTDLTSAPVRVLDAGPLVTGGDLLPNARYDIGADGTLLYVPLGTLGSSEEHLVWVDRQGNRDRIMSLSQLPGAFSRLLAARLSPDGSRVAFRANVDESHRYRLFTWDLEQGGFASIPVDGNADWPVWLDDQRLVFNHFRGDEQDLYWAHADGSGEPEPWIPPNPLQQHAGQVAFDGSVLLMQQRPTADHPDSDIVMVPMDGPKDGVALVHTTSAEVQPALDPTGQWLAYASNQSGRFEVYVTEFPEPRRDIPISSGGGTSPVWNPAGGELFYRRGGQIRAVTVSTDSGFRQLGERLLFEGRFKSCCSSTGAWGRTFDVSADGLRFLLVEEEIASDVGIPRIEMIQGWLGRVARQLER